ncbi:unnamed protein product [Discosporangium mesarthrocarpum]
MRHLEALLCLLLPVVSPFQSHDYRMLARFRSPSPCVSKLKMSLSVPRRDAIIFGGSLAWGGVSVASRALDPDETAVGSSIEGISKVASTIPGYGPPDLLFPEWFAGSWTARREVVSVSTPMGEEKVEDKEVLRDALNTVGEKLEYKVLFLRRGRNGEQVVADRGFNEKNMRNARCVCMTSSSCCPLILALS